MKDNSINCYKIYVFRDKDDFLDKIVDEYKNSAINEIVGGNPAKIIKMRGLR